MSERTITKTFYVNHRAINELKNDNFPHYSFSNKNKRDGYIEIQISWKEPERKVEITESEFDELAKEWNRTPSEKEKFNFLRQRLFGASDE